MPNIQSAKKRMRQNIKKRATNRMKKSSIRTTEKKIRKLTLENKLDQAKDTLKLYFSILDKAAKTNLIHKNAAGRKKSRLTQLLKKSDAVKTTAPAATPAPVETVTETPESGTTV